MKHSINDIIKYVDSLAPEVQDLLTLENLDVLRRHEVDHSNAVTTYEFPNGYSVQCWYHHGAYAHDTFPVKNPDDVLSVDGVTQVECWIHMWNVMNRPPYDSTHVVEDVINNIRSRCDNIDDLRKIQAFVDGMLTSLQQDLSEDEQQQERKYRK